MTHKYFRELAREFIFKGRSERELIRNGGSVVAKTGEAELLAKFLSRRLELVSTESDEANEMTKPTSTTAADSDRRFIRLEDIKPSPFQPRQDFDPKKLRELADSLKDQQLTDCLVRLSPGYKGASAKQTFELIGGERRLRAAKLAKLSGLWCRVITADNKQAEKLATFDNLNRENLNELEKLQAYQRMLDHGVFASLKELAPHLKITPSALSNKLRILAVPQQWLDLISQETFGVTATHLRFIVPWKDRSNVMDAVLADLQEEAAEYGEGWRCPVGTFEQIVTYAAKRCSRPIDSCEFIDPNPGLRVTSYVDETLTPQQRSDKQLDLQPLKLDGKTEQRAFNISLWEDFILSQRKETRKKDSAKQSPETSKPKQQPRKSSATERKGSVALQRKVDRWTLTQLQRRIAERLEAVDAGPIDQQPLHLAEIVLGHLLYFATNSDSASKRMADLMLSIEDADGTASTLTQISTFDVFASLASLPKGSDRRATLFGVVCRTLSRWWLGSCDGHRPDVAPAAIEQAAEQLGVSITDDWELTEEFLKLHSLTELLALAREWSYEPKVSLSACTTITLIDELLESCSDKGPPAVLRTK